MNIAWTPKDFFMGGKRRDLADCIIKSINGQLGSYIPGHRKSYEDKRVKLDLDARTGKAIDKLSDEQQINLWIKIKMRCRQAGWEVEHGINYVRNTHIIILKGL